MRNRRRPNRYETEPTYSAEFRKAMKALGVPRDEWLYIWEHDACPEACADHAEADVKAIMNPTRFETWRDDYFPRKVRIVMALIATTTTA